MCIISGIVAAATAIGTALGTVGTAVTGALGITGLSAGATMAVGGATIAAGGAALGAGVGMTTAAITGGNIGKGALFGALGGAAGGFIGAPVAGTLAGGLGAVGGAIAGSAVGGLAGGAVSSLKSARDARNNINTQGQKDSALGTATQTTSQVAATQRYAKTADTLKDRSLLKRTLSSLRIPLNQSTATVGLNIGETTTTGLNIA